jgi:hypothetical protein
MGTSHNRYALAEVLLVLSKHDPMAKRELWNFLYDWGNRLPICTSALELVLAENNLSQESKELLLDTDAKIRSLAEDIRKALLDYAQLTSESSDVID